MPDPYASWARAAQADPTIPITSKRVAEVLADHFRAHDGKASLTMRALIEAAALLDERPVRLLVSHGWITRSSHGGTNTPATFKPTVPLACARLDEAAPQ